MLLEATVYEDASQGHVVLRVRVDASGEVVAERGLGTAQGALSRDAVARIAERIRTARIGMTADRVGIGNSHGRLSVEAGTLLVRFEGDPRSEDPSSWKVPVAGGLLVLAAKIAVAAASGTLARFDTGLPPAIDRNGVLLRYKIGSGPSPTVVVYQDGRMEHWKTDGEWTGTRVGQAWCEMSAARTTHEAVVRLWERIRGMPPRTLDAAHDPTSSMSVSFDVRGQLQHLSFSWGRASQNDAYLSPVPDGVPIELFNEAFGRLSRLRSSPEGLARDSAPATRPRSAPEPSVVVSNAGGPLRQLNTILDSWLDKTPVDSPEPGPPAAAPTPQKRTPEAPRVAADLRGVVSALIARPPRTMRDLEAAIGGFAAFETDEDGMGRLRRRHVPPHVSALFVRYAWDLHHERPYGPGDGRRERNPAILHVDLGFGQGLFAALKNAFAPGTVVIDTLREHFGEGEAFEGPPGKGLRFGQFFAQAGERLNWFAQIPDWTIRLPAVDPRPAWLAALRRELERGMTHQAALAFVKDAPALIEVHGSLNPGDVQMTLRPALEAGVFADAFGLSEPLTYPGGTHMDLFRIVTRSEGRHVHPFSSPVIGPWEISAAVSAVRDGVVVDEWAGFPIYDLRRTPGVTVSHLQITHLGHRKRS